MKSTAPPGRFVDIRGPLLPHDLGYQTLVDIDPVSGLAEYREGMIQEIGEEIHWCPSTAGFKSWRAMSYNPETEAFYSC